MFSISRIQQLMQGLSRVVFNSIVDRHQGDKHVKGFNCFSLLVAHVFGQISGSRSLRELVAGYNSQVSQHYHLGTRQMRRATLADASASRNPAIFEEVVRALMASASRQVRRQVKEGLLLLDSTSFTLKGPGFDEWTSDNRTRNTQGLKLHIVYDPGSATPVLQEITAANVNDVTQAASIALKRGSTYVFDKGYCDYAWWARFSDHGALFVTRLKSNARTATIRARAVPAADQAVVLSDEVIRFANKHPGGTRKLVYTAPLRRVTVARPDHSTPLVIVTNDFKRSAAEIAACYKARWQIELFFKWIKQNLRIKRFLGRTQNAVRIQILCALATYLLVAIYRARHAVHASMLEVMASLRVSMFQRPLTEALVERRRRTRKLAQLAVQPGLFA